MRITKIQSLCLFTAITLLGFALRVSNINRVALRGDEAFTLIHWVREPIEVTLFGEVAVRDPQPPLAYLTYYLWGQIVGNGIETLRFLPALFNLIGTAALYALGTHFQGRRAGLIAAAIWALHPLEIWHAQDARNYALWGASTAVSLWLALRALKSARSLDWALYVFVAAVSAYLYYLELFVVAALNVYVLIVHIRQRRVLGRWLLSQIVLALLLAPWFLQERLLFGSGYGGTAGQFDLMQLITWFVPTLMFGETSFVNHNAVLALLLAFSLLVLLLIRLRQQRTEGVLLMALVFVPLLGIAVASTRLNVFVPRYVMSVVIPLVLLVVVYIESGKRVVRILIGGLLVLGLVTSYMDYAIDYTKAPDWHSLTTYLANVHRQPGAIINASADEAYTLYHQESDLADELYRLPANPNQSEDEIVAALEQAMVEHESLWLVAETPPDWENRGIVEMWLEGHMQRGLDTHVGGIRLEQYLRPDVDVTALPSQPLAEFEGVVSLQAADFVPPPERHGVLFIQLIWLPESSTSAGLKSFIHVVGPINPDSGSPLWAQDDQLPLDGALSSTSWPVDVPFRDIYEIDVSGVSAGTYELRVGWYDEVSGQRLEADGSTEYVLGELRLTEDEVFVTIE